MATTKKSTKAKTKTAKKPATKKSTKAAASRAAKTTKKSVATKAVKAAPVKKSTAAQGGISKQLRVLNIVTAVFSVGLAVAAGFLMNNATYQIFTGLLTKDEIASKAGTVFVPAIHPLFDLELRWAVVVIMALSAIMPILLLTVYKDRYAGGLKAKAQKLRWIEMAVISALIVETIALLSGVQDIMVLKLIAGLIIVTCALACVAEKQNVGVRKPVWNTYVVGLVTGILPWLLIAAYAIGTTVWGLVRLPWYVYALYATTVIGFLANGMNQARQFRALQDYETTERNYLQAGIFIKVAFAAILIIGLLK